MYQFAPCSHVRVLSLVPTYAAGVPESGKRYPHEHEERRGCNGGENDFFWDLFFSEQRRCRDDDAVGVPQPTLYFIRFHHTSLGSCWVFWGEKASSRLRIISIWKYNWAWDQDWNKEEREACYQTPWDNIHKEEKHGHEYTVLGYENRMVASDLQIINLIANLCCRLYSMNSLHPLSTPHCGSNYPAKVLSVIKTASCMIIYQRLLRRGGELWHLLARSPPQTRRQLRPQE